MSNPRHTMKEELLPQYNVVVIGAGGTGKSCLTNQFVTGVFTEDYDPTIEDSYRKRVNVDGEMGVLDILDTAGQEEYSSMLDEYLRNGQGFVLVYSITSESSFSEIQNFKDKLWRCKEVGLNESVPFLLVGNKCDLENERQVTTGEGEGLAKFFGCPFMETSAKTGINVTEVFQQIVREIRKDIQAKGLTLQKTEPPNAAYMEKLMKKFAKWKVKFDLSGKLEKTRDSIQKLTNKIFNRSGTKSDSSARASQIGTPEDPSSSNVVSSPSPSATPDLTSSENKPSSSFEPQNVSNNSSFNHTLSQEKPPEQPVQSKNLYGKIPQIVRQQQEEPFSEYPFFHPTLSGGDADALLSGAAPGTFLIRPSSQQDHLAVSYVDDFGVQKALIAYNPDKTAFWMSANSSVTYPDLNELVESLNNSLRIPYNR